MRSRDEDIIAIHRVIETQQVAFNTNDADLLAEPWRERSWGVGVTGAETAGRSGVREAGQTLLAGPLADQYATYEPGEVEFLTDDVAIVHVYARAVTASGQPIDVDHTMIALYVLAHEGGRWLIVARQNTLVQR
jgi:uncharacterized protein (TIGR02246 family)